MEYKYINWFNLSAPFFRIKNNYIKLWNFFNKKCVGARYWGIGIIQINTWHFLYIGDIGFIFCHHTND